MLRRKEGVSPHLYMYYANGTDLHTVQVVDLVQRRASIVLHDKRDGLRRHQHAHEKEKRQERDMKDIPNNLRTLNKI